MKSVFSLLLLLSFAANAQKTEERSLNSIQNISNTDYMVIYSSSYSKVGLTNKYNNSVVFINTKSSEVSEIEIPSKSYIRKLITNIDAKYINSNFILVECSTEVDRVLPKSVSRISELYLITLDDFKVVKISSDGFALKSWEINENNNSLVVLEEQNGVKNTQYNVQQVTLVNLRDEDKKIIFSVN